VLPVRLIEDVLHRKTRAEGFVHVPAEADVGRHPSRRASRVDAGVGPVTVAQPVLSGGEANERLDPQAGKRAIENADLAIERRDPVRRDRPAVAELLLPPCEGKAARDIEVIEEPKSAPSFDPEVWKQLASPALAVTLFALTEALSISRALSVRSGQHISGNQEFIGQGLSNIAGSFFSAYVATGSFNRSGLNFDSGAKTPLAAIVAGAALALIVLLVAPLAVYMPNAAMAGVLMLVAYGLIDQHHIHQILKTSRAESAVLIVTFLSTLFLELQEAIFAGVLLSLLLYLNRTSHPHIRILVPDPDHASRKFITNLALPECRQLRIVRIDGSLFFGAVNYFQETLRAYEQRHPDQNFLIVEMSGVNFVDIAGAEALAQAARRFKKRGGLLYLLNVKESVMETLHKGGYDLEIGLENFFHSKTQALRSIYPQLDHEKCKACQDRVFVECRLAGRKEPSGEDFEAA